MAQIAGRAGRHQRDGTFGTLGLEGGGATGAASRRRWPRSRAIISRRSTISSGATARPTRASLDSSDRGRSSARPDRQVLRAAPEAIDLAVLKRLAGEPWVAERTKRPGDGGAALGSMRPARFPQDGGGGAFAGWSARLFGHLSEGARPCAATSGSPRSWRGSTMCRAMSRRWPTGSRPRAHGPISRTGPTG